jgi:flagellar motor switch protein FliM
MARAEASSMIGRKIAAGRPQADPFAMTAERAVGLALGRTAERMMKLPLAVAALRLDTLTAPEIVDGLPDRALLAMIEGPAEAMGLIAFGPGLLSALVEMMTLARLSPADPAPRRPTRTDAAMVAGFIDGVLGDLDLLLAAELDRVWAGGFRYASHLADPRPLGLMLDEPGYRCFRLTLSLGPPGDGARRGELTLVLPAAGRGTRPAPPSSAAANRAGADQARWDAALERAVLGAPARIEAVLARVTLPLSGLLALEPGMSLTLPVGSLARVQVEGAGGRLLCLARLGQGNGVRALRLDLAEGGEADPPLPAVAGLAQAIPAHAQPLTRPADPTPARVTLGDAAALPDPEVGTGGDRAPPARRHA